MARRRKSTRTHRPAPAFVRVTAPLLSQASVAMVPSREELCHRATERHRRKKLRREICEDFSQLLRAQGAPSYTLLRQLLRKHAPNLDVLCDALGKYKTRTDPWSVETWALLCLNEQQLQAHIQEDMCAEAVLIRDT